MTTQATDPRLDVEQHLHMYRQMAKIRAFEEQVNELTGEMERLEGQASHLVRFLANRGRLAGRPG